MLTVGRITKLFGASGEVVINLYDTLPDNFNWEEQPLFTKVEELVVPLFCEKFERRGTKSAVVAFADIDTVKRAEMILDHELLLEAEEGDDDEFTFEDLIGFEVRVGRTKGELVDYYDNELNPLFEIEIKGKRHLVPAVEEFIAAIDFDKGVIKFVLPDGLIE
ncbi:MAG: 16S rRNA processing protein RimM [Alistipes sp.]|jgi:16S rRNA processing protein RimM|nr:16S rRNA processing protein RimM [Alistipes sp.]MBQ5836979.1 16S rRNA processing protein RimM [Alistipes sp.]